MNVDVCITSISRRLGKKRDWVVALKALMLIHRLMTDGDPVFQQEIVLYANRKGTRLLNLSDFRDEAHSNSWDYLNFVRFYALYLDQKLELMLFERKQRGEVIGYDSWEDGFGCPTSRDEPKIRSFGDVGESNGREEEKGVITPLRDWKPEKIYTKMSYLQKVLDRLLVCWPTGLAKNNRRILIALYPVVQESFKVYADICEVLVVLLDKFFEMENSDCVKAFDAYASSAKQIDELIGFYSWCKESGVGKSSEFPDVQRITGKLLETLQEFVRDRTMRLKSPERKPDSQPARKDQEEKMSDMNEIKAIPGPVGPTPRPPPPAPPATEPEPKQETWDLIDLKEEGNTADSQGNKFALALFAGSGENENGSEKVVTSAWKNPTEWELALVEHTSNLSHQTTTMGGGLDPLVLNGMYDSGTVRQHLSTSQVTGSASSVVLPGLGKPATPVLALPGPDGSVQSVRRSICGFVECPTTCICTIG